MVSECRVGPRSGKQWAGEVAFQTGRWGPLAAPADPAKLPLPPATGLR